MKKLYLSLFVLVFGACTNTMEENIPAPSPSDSPAKENYGVKFADVLKLAQCQKTTTRAADASVEVKCITGKEKDTLLFVCKRPEGGWVMYSSDTRVPPVVAESGSGSFDKLMEIDGARLWIEAMAEDMAAIKRCSDANLKFSKEEIENNKRFWKSISSVDELLEGNKSTTRVRDPGGLIPNGHYELYQVDTYTEVFDSVPRMTTTNWHQGFPLNKYCPHTTYDYGTRAPAGSVAIAGAQMLYYLHNFYGVPETAPSEAYCNSVVNQPYVGNQTNFTTEVWSDIAVDDSAAAPLIAHVGYRLTTNYQDYFSISSIQRLVNKVFGYYGVSSRYATYNTEDLVRNLQNNLPVVLSAEYLSMTGDNEDYNISAISHAFIADRYKCSRRVTKMYYNWVYDFIPPFTYLPQVPPKVEYSYSSPWINYIGMNWGWGYNHYFPDEWFSLTGDWIHRSYPNQNYNYGRDMVCDFAPINH